MPHVSFESVITRLKEIAGTTSDAKLAHELGLSPQALGNRRKAGSIPYELIVKYAANKGVDLSWILLGEKNPSSTQYNDKSSSESNPSVPLIEDIQSTNPNEAHPFSLQENFVLVPRYDIEASTGHGSIIDQEEIIEHLAFKREWIYRMGLNPNNLSLISVRGDSMEPTLGRGDLVLIDRRVDRILDHAIYVLWLDGLRLKRIQQKVDGSITILSDNPAYRPEEVDPLTAEQLTVVGRAVWVGKRL